MRVAGVVLVGCLLCAGAFAEDDPLEAGRTLLGGPENARAIELLRKVIAEGETAKQDAGKQLRAGRALFYLDEDAQAAEAIERAVALAPKDARPLYWLGVVWSYSDADKAIAALERSLAVDAKQGDAWLELGRVRARKKQHAEALKAYEQASALDPENAEAHYRAGTELHEIDRIEEAIGRYRKALALDPKQVSAGFNLGLIEYLAGRFEQAREAWLAVEPHAGEDLQLRAKLVQAHYALGRYEEAGKWRDKVFHLHATAKDEDTRKLTEFCFDQFVVDDMRVLAFEQFDKSEEALSLYRFRATRDGKIVQRINLEPEPFGKQLGGPEFLLGANDDEGHLTYKKGWKEQPPYPELKTAVIDALRGKLGVASRSKKSGEIEIGK